MKKLNLLPYLFIFLTTILVVQLIQGGSREDPVLDSGDIGITTTKNEYAVGKDIQVEIQNNTENTVTLPARCISNSDGSNQLLLPPVTIYRYENKDFVTVESTELPDCSETKDIILEASQKTKISLHSYAYSYFGEPGRYKISVDWEQKNYESPEFQINEPGVVTQLWRLLIYNPILNVLIALLIYIPGHYLGLAIMGLTIFIRTLLLIPSQKAIKAQMRMQELQPKLEELKKKYANDQARLAQETMLLWSSHKVNPLSSCLPILIQFPILIALFYVVNGGLSPDRAGLIYDFLPSFSFQEINPNFLGFNLLKRSLMVFPLVVGGLQFLQMQLMTARRKKQSSPSTAKLPNEMETANKMMKYIMPVMIAIFTAQLPSAVGLYWGTSTFYGIIQQLVVNKGHSKISSSPDDVEIRVINHPHGKTN